MLPKKNVRQAKAVAKQVIKKSARKTPTTLLGTYIQKSVGQRLGENKK